MIECTERDRSRIFNLGYYTWVEQQGTPFELFEAAPSARRSGAACAATSPVWDEMITEFNARGRRLTAERPSLIGVGWRCAVCGATGRHRRAARRGGARTVDRRRPPPRRCDSSGATAPLPRRSTTPTRSSPSTPHLAWEAFAAAARHDADGRRALVRELDDAVAASPAPGSRVTPFARVRRAVATRSGSPTTAACGSRTRPATSPAATRRRHLFTILLHLVAAESLGRRAVDAASDRPPLAIASCGNAALAAATLGRRGRLADRGVRADVGRPGGARARSTSSARRSPRARGVPTTRPATRAVLRFREAVAAGAVPFSVQGPENALCLDGGRTIGWEMADAGADARPRRSCRSAAERSRACVGRRPRPPASIRCSTPCRPRLRAAGPGVGAAAGLGGADAGAALGRVMTPWEPSPHSAADGILDDETYDWLGVLDVVRRSRRPPGRRSEAAIVAGPRARRRRPASRSAPPAPPASPAS